MSKKTPLFEIHKKLGAKIVSFSGFEMPLYYRGIVEEHLWVRRKAGLFDVSHMGEIRIRGKEALEFVSFVTSNDPSSLSPYHAQYTLLLNREGGIVDDAILYNLEESYLLVVNASNIDKDLKWLLSFASHFDIEIEDESESTALLALQGPLSEEVLSSLTTVNLKEVGYFSTKRGDVLGRKAIISRTGYTGEDGFEIFLRKEDASFVFEKILQNERVIPAGLGARDTLRLEMGYCLYGDDIDESVSPLEADLLWVVKMNKGEFVGKEALVEKMKKGPKRRRIGIESEKGIPRKGDKVYFEGKETGYVTSGTFSPSLKRGIAIAYVDSEIANPGNSLEIEIRGKKVKSKIVKFPFYRKGSIRRGK